jgi:hypothetical protein
MIPAVHFRSNGLYCLTSLLTSLTLNKFGDDGPVEIRDYVPFVCSFF